MGYITLAPGVVFDIIDGEGCLIFLMSGDAYALDPAATKLLEVGLLPETVEDALVSVHARIEANEQQIAEDFQFLYQQMLDLGAIGQQSVYPLSSREAKEPTPLPYHVMDVPPQRPSSNDALFQEFFLTGQLTRSPLPQISWWKRAAAIWHVMTLLMALGQFRFRRCLMHQLVHQRERVRTGRQAWRYLCQTLSCISRYQIKLADEALVCFARRELVYCQLVVRLLAPTAYCLLCSAAFCTYLRSLGLPAQVVIGRSLFDPSDERFAFHAWTELAGRVVNDYAEVQSGYHVIQRLPPHNEKEPFLFYSPV